MTPNFGQGALRRARLPAWFPPRTAGFRRAARCKPYGRMMPLVLVFLLAACGEDTHPGPMGGTLPDAGNVLQGFCIAPLLDCSEMCVEASTDPTHCGGCGTACAAGEACGADRRKESFSAQGAVSQVRRIGLMSTRRPWKFSCRAGTAILGQPDAMRQESWHTSASRLESRLSPSSSVQNIIGYSMGPSDEGLAIGGAPTHSRAGAARFYTFGVTSLHRSRNRFSALGPNHQRWNQQSVSSGELARVYGFTDVDGTVNLND